MKGIFILTPMNVNSEILQLFRYQRPGDTWKYKGWIFSMKELNAKENYYSFSGGHAIYAHIDFFCIKA